MSLLTAPLVNNSHIFLEFALSFNIKFRTPWKDPNNSYQVGQVLTLFCK